MKNIFILTKLNIKRNYYALLLSVLGAAMLSLLLYSLGNLIADSTVAKVNIGVLDYDNSSLSQDLKQYMKEELNYNLLENYSYDDLATELIDKDISVIIEIPDGLFKSVLTEEMPKIQITSLEDYENIAFIEAYVNSYISSIRILASGAKGNQEAFNQLLKNYKEEDITLNQTAAGKIIKEEVFGKNGFINSVGFFLMFIFSISVILAFMVEDDRLKGVFNRIQVTPVKPFQYIMGSGIFGLLLCIVQVGLFVAFIIFNDIKTGVPVGIIFLMLMLFSLFTICFSLLVALATKSRNAITAIIIGFSTVGCILGGAYFPLDMAPDSLQKMARILPQYWFMDAFRQIQADPLSNIYPNIIILSLYIVLSFLIGAVLFAQNYKSS